MNVPSRNHQSNPQSIKELSVAAESLDFDPLIPIRYWIRAAATCEREARVYEREGDYQQAYTLYFRYVHLLINKVPKHPEFPKQKNDLAFLTAQKKVVAILQQLETLKPTITRRYEKYQASLKEGQARQNLDQNKRRSKEYNYEKQHHIRQLVPAENPQVVVELAQKERRRRAKRDAQPQGPSKPSKPSKPASSSPYTAQSPVGPTGNTYLEDLYKVINESGDWLSDSKNKPFRKSPNAPINTPSSYYYPSVPSAQRDSKPVEPVRPTPIRPQRPPKESIPSFSPTPPPEKTPPKPDKVALSLPSPIQTPSPDKQTIKFEARATLENGTPLRSVLLPSGLRSSFLKVAAKNTEANLETCGVLCGTLISNALYISKLVIPEQTSTSDTCETTNEGALFDYCDREDLLMLGWIHTHPTQDCFMSSRDQHTHCGYQVMMAESIAIVCAPRRTPSWGVFRLTDPPGMQCILSCNQPGIFHPHSEPNIYTDANTNFRLDPERRGHVLEIKGLDYDVVDLRP